jgi:proteic killer suppression protein
MEIEYKTKKLKKQCENPKVAQKDYGASIGNKLTQRIEEFIAAISLLDIKRIPSARLHKLKGTRADEYVVDLIGSYRLVFVPILQEGEDINELESINIVRIEEVTDYHGKQKR